MTSTTTLQDIIAIKLLDVNKNKENLQATQGAGLGVNSELTTIQLQRRGRADKQSDKQRKKLLADIEAKQKEDVSYTPGTTTEPDDVGSRPCRVI